MAELEWELRSLGLKGYNLPLWVGIIQPLLNGQDRQENAIREIGIFGKIQEDLINRVSYIFFNKLRFGFQDELGTFREDFPKVATQALFTILHGLASIQWWGPSLLPLNQGRPQ